VAKRLNLLLRHESRESLAGVLDDAAGTLLANFAASMQRDLPAVQAALELPWTTSPPKGRSTALYHQAGHVSPRRLPTPPRPRPVRRMNPKRQHGKCGRTQLSTPIDTPAVSKVANTPSLTHRGSESERP